LGVTLERRFISHNVSYSQDVILSKENWTGTSVVKNSLSVAFIKRDTRVPANSSIKN